MRRLALGLCLAACAPATPGPAALPPRPAAAPVDAAPPFRGVDCLDLVGAPRRHLQRGPDGALWLERWRLRPAPPGPTEPALLGALVRVDPTTGREEPVLTDILTAHVRDDHLIALRARGERRVLTVAALDGSDERPLTPPDHPVSSHAPARDGVLYTTPDGVLHRRRLAADAPERLADDILAVLAELPNGEPLVHIARPDAELAVLRGGDLHPLGLAPARVTLSEGHVLIDTPSGPRSLDGATDPAGLRTRPGELDDTDLHLLARTDVADALAVPAGLWALVRHDTDGDGSRDALLDEADLCRLERGSPSVLALPRRDRPRTLDTAWPALAQLATGDLSQSTLTREAGLLVVRAPGPGPRTLAALRARAAAVHREAAALLGTPDLDLVLEWSANHRHAAVSWDSRTARPALVVGGHDLAVPDAPVRASHRLLSEPLPDGRHRVTCEGHVAHDLPRPLALELRCAARLHPGDPEPLAAAAIVLADMSPETSHPFTIDLGALDLRPAASDLRAAHPDGDLALADAAALADLDDMLATLDAAAALGFAPPEPPALLGRAHARAFVHPAPRLAAPPDFAGSADVERARRARALWELLAAHADRHHGGRLAPAHLAGTRDVIRRGRLE